LQFAKAGSAATLPQQEKNNWADVQRGRVNINGFISPTHTRTERRAPVWGSELLQKPLHYRGVPRNWCLCQTDISVI
jgi:hypothetical protein